MRIGYFNARGPNNGIEHWFDLEIEELRKRGHEVRTFYLKGNQPTLEDIKWMDFAHFHFAQVAAYYRTIGVPYIISPHAHDIWRDNGWTLKLAASNENCKGISYQSFYHKKKFEEWGITKSLFHLPMCCRTKLFKRQTPYNPSGKIIAGGRLIPKKGLDRLKGMESKISIFGDGQLKDQLQEMLGSKVQMLGYLNGNELKDLFEESSIYLFPAIVTPDKDSDGIPNTVKEAMLMELQIISSPIAGIPELENISLLSDWSKESIEKAISCLPKEPNTKGRVEILKNFSPEICVNKLIKIIENQ
jgi:glycosyltransferase involved in cell wall biosynthesis